MPAFVDVWSGEAGRKLVRRIGKQATRKFINRNGVVRQPRERLDDLRIRAARRYVRNPRRMISAT